MQLNEAGRRKGKSMIESSQYVLDSSWTDANPSADEENAFSRTIRGLISAMASRRRSTAAEETKERYGFPYGDFRRVHRSGLIAAKQRAAQNDYADIERAADSLLSLLDQQTG